MNARVFIPVRAKKVVQRISPVTPTAAAPTSVPAAANRCLPAASITAPASTKPCRSPLGGQTKRPRSSRFANKHNPSPSYHRTLIRSPLRPRNTNTCPENGFCSSLLSTSALSPVNPRRKSVTPAAIQTRVFVGGPIIPVGTPATRAPTPHRHCLRCASALAAVRCESCPAVVSRSRRTHAPAEAPANSRSREPAATSWPP